MSMTYIWSGILVISIVYGLISGNIAAVGSSVIEGAQSAVTLCVGICGAMCLWSGLMEVMNRSGLSEKLAALLDPILRLLFPTTKTDRDALDALSQNITANFLGLGNAATPAGIKAAGLLSKAGCSAATNELCMLVVINTASIQLIPTTACSLRASLGSALPFDILPAVWITSLCSVTAGILSAKLLERFTR